MIDALCIVSSLFYAHLACHGVQYEVNSTIKLTVEIMEGIFLIDLLLTFIVDIDD